MKIIYLKLEKEISTWNCPEGKAYMIAYRNADIKDALNMGLYKPIGEAPDMELEETFIQLQNDSHKNGHPLNDRSMCTGDIVEKSGTFWVAKSIGFKKIENPILIKKLYKL